MNTLDFILIHGYNLTENGELDYILIDRLDFSLDVHQKEGNKGIIVAGKWGIRDKGFLEREGETQSSFMRHYLEDKGVPSNEIYEENQGENTFDCTINAFRRIIIPQIWKTGHVVSTEEHLTRIQIQTEKVLSLLAKEGHTGLPKKSQLGYSGPSITSSTTLEESLRFCQRELTAIKYTLSRSD